uniref:Uncharacterized protein n=1 Tax=candidate division CPR3 bacterium TaxID=2268181 RepID=A0A7C4R512_UNCC3
MKRCSKCSRRVSENAKSCVFCGGDKFDKNGLVDGLPTNFVSKQTFSRSDSNSDNSNKKTFKSLLKKKK